MSFRLWQRGHSNLGITLGGFKQQPSTFSSVEHSLLLVQPHGDSHAAVSPAHGSHLWFFLPSAPLAALQRRLAKFPAPWPAGHFASSVTAISPASPATLRSQLQCHCLQVRPQLPHQEQHVSTLVSAHVLLLMLLFLWYWILKLGSLH